MSARRRSQERAGDVLSRSASAPDRSLLSSAQEPAAIEPVRAQQLSRVNKAPLALERRARRPRHSASSHSPSAHRSRQAALARVKAEVCFVRPQPPARGPDCSLDQMPSLDRGRMRSRWRAELWSSRHSFCGRCSHPTSLLAASLAPSLRYTRPRARYAPRRPRQLVDLLPPPPTPPRLSSRSAMAPSTDTLNAPAHDLHERAPTPHSVTQRRLDIRPKKNRKCVPSPPPLSLPRPCREDVRSLCNPATGLRHRFRSSSSASPSARGPTSTTKAPSTPSP